MPPPERQAQHDEEAAELHPATHQPITEPKRTSVYDQFYDLIGNPIFRSFVRQIWKLLPENLKLDRK